MTIEIFAETGKKHVFDLTRVERSPVGVRKQKGILAPDSDPAIDADVIMTAAIIGYAVSRVGKNLNCQFTYEPDTDIEKAEVDRQAHEQAIAKVRSVLVGVRCDASAVSLGVTPVFNRDDLRLGENRIIGGTGSLSLTDPNRLKPPTPTGSAKELFEFATTNDAIRERLGYQGRGAYTGFIDGRKDGQTALMSTFRFRAAEDGVIANSVWGSRWMPSGVQRPPVGVGRTERIWGMIATNWDQEKTASEGMYFQDSDCARGWTGLNPNHIVGYVHGMIQAIYEVASHPKGEGGIPYEIAVGKETSKLASCFPCTLFMEATEYPASSVHLGRGESWCILHATDKKTSGDAARNRCNDQWAAYCAEALAVGAEALKGRVNTKPNKDQQTHERSLTELLKVIEGTKSGTADYRLANLILDAVTVHDGEYKRINRTITMETSPDSTGVKGNSSKPAQAALPCQKGTLKVTLELVVEAAAGVTATVVVAKGEDPKHEQIIPLDRVNTAVFTDLPPGEYTVSVGPTPGPLEVKVPALGYQVPTAGRATVEVDKTAKVTLRFRPWDWIQVAFLDGLEREYEIKLPGAADFVKGKGRFAPLPSGVCTIRITT